METSTEQLIDEITASYYKYVVKIESGSRAIIAAIREKDLGQAAYYLQALSEGFIWLVESEELLEIHSYQSDNKVGELIPLFEKINAVLDQNDFAKVEQILEEDVIPVFQQAKYWRFEKVIS